jgi:ligand-binding sensor domain-containing protein/signal transduction histidine kinase
VTIRSTATVLAVTLLAGPRPSLALDPRKAITQYGHDVWQREDGLPHSMVKAIRQSRDGYLWLATEEGLVRFDGARFTVFDSTSTPEMRVSFVHALTEDEQGALWIGTNGGGLIRYQDGAFTAYPVSGSEKQIVRAVAAARDGGLWLGASEVGLFQMKKGVLTPAPIPPSIDVQGLPSGIWVLHEDSQGTVWVATRARGLLSFKAGRVRRFTVRDGLPDAQIWSLADAADGGLWVGTDKGLAHLARDGTIVNSLAGEPIRALLEDRDGGLWVGSGSLRRLHQGRWQQVGTAEGLSSESVCSLHQDREGSLWVGTIDGGLNRLRDGPFTTIGAQEGLSSEVTRAVYQHPDGTVWVGTKGGGASAIKDGAISALTTKAGLSDDTVVSFAADREQALWLGTIRGGLNRLKDGKVTVYGTANGLPDASVFALLGRPDGSLWIGHRGGGLTRFQEGRFFRYGTAEGLRSGFVWTIVEGRDGTLWIGTANGLYILSGGEIRPVIPEIAAHVVHLDPDGVVWAGSATGGLYRWKDGRADAITRREGLFDNNVAGILEDDRGRLWMSCNKGIYSVAKQELHDVADGRAARVHPVAYDTWDGMKSSECSYGSSWKTTDGRLWFPTARGVVVVNPGDLRKNGLPPPVVIEEITANGRSLDASAAAPLEVPPGDGRLHVRFTALSLVAPRKVRFSYRLDGLDDAWSEAGTAREASYTNLRPGRYAFRVRACNNDGVWNEEGASVRFHLQPRFHQTAWFYGLCVLGVVFTGWQGHRFRLRRLLEMERVRTRIAADLHDDVGSGLSQISILSGVATAQLRDGGASAPRALGQIASTAEELVDSMGDIVWAMDPGHDRLGDLVHRMRRFATEVCGARDIALGWKAEGLDEARAIGPDFRRHAYLLFKESVSNAARHSGCRRAEVEIAAGAHLFSLRVKDDGKGFDAGSAGQGHGLKTMGQRARDLGGRLEITSTPGEGTAVSAELPFARPAKWPWS